MGHFASAAAAATAHGVDKSTIMNRCQTQPDIYQKVADGRVEPVKKKAAAEPQLHVTRRTWPLTWYQYKILDWDTREMIWQAWCVAQQLDPEQESTVDAFFEAMDQVQEVIT
jgi:hypothetical protein